MTDIKQVRAALEEAEAVLALSERPAQPDPAYHEEVKALGRSIGFGALMHTAEAGWREVAEECGDPSGGEHTHGPCRATVDECLHVVRQALSALTRLEQAGAWREPALAKRPVAWRVKDYADHWIIFQNEDAANREVGQTGAVMQGLYVRDGTFAAAPPPPKPAEERG